jgi:2-succinyl-5-enolpyruvyl-6-hydroxy-3-cyclohexene-1-carboxylate synthase
MANQTCDQIKFFGAYVRYFVDLPLPDPSLPENFIPNTVAHAVFWAQYPHPGPVQINCPFREPFFSDQKALPSCGTVHTIPTLALESPEPWAEELSQIKRGVIVLGRGAPDATALSEKLGWPILPDILSSYREKASNRTVAHYHHVLQALPDLHTDCVLHMGDAPVSKKLLQWMAKARRYIHVAAHHKRCDPHHAVTDRIVCDPASFCKQITSHAPVQDQEWFLEWQKLGERVRECLHIPDGSEPAALQHLGSDTALFFGNSMPIRDADMFFFPKAPCGPIFANRGLSGIDGNIATIAGIAQHHPVTAIIGDQTALHDLNSLALLKKTKHRARIIILNNGGGGIFSFVAKEAKGLLDPYFAAAHNLTFAHAAAQFGLSYANHWQEGADITELFSNREENFALHQQISDQICSSFSTVS